jgi:hypothetical protein
MTNREKLLDLRAGKRFTLRINRPSKSCLHCKAELQPAKPLKLYVTINTYPDGRPGEMFIKIDNHESGLALGALDAAAIAVSMALQNGVPFESLMAKWIGLRFEPSGTTGNSEFPFVASALDYVGRWALARFGKKEEIDVPA